MNYEKFWDGMYIAGICLNAGLALLTVYGIWVGDMPTSFSTIGIGLPVVMMGLLIYSKEREMKKKQEALR